MPLALHATYRNRTAAVNTDRTGKMFIDLADGAVASTFWRFKHQGDGIAMYSTATTRQFTANSGLGYITNGTSWSTSSGKAGGANSFSNTFAYYVLAELDGSGSPTGRELLVQRHSGNTATVVNNMTIAISLTGFTGTANATTAPSGNAQVLLGTINGSGGDFFATMGVGGTAYPIASGNTVTYSIWISDAPSGTTGDVSPLALLCYDATSSNDLGSVFFYEALVKATATDDHPCIAAAGTWANMFSETGNTATTTFASSGQGMYSGGAAGAITACAFAKTGLPNAITEPDAVTQSDVRDLGGDLPLLRANVYLDAATPVFKGVCETLKLYFPPSSSYVFPHTAFADVAHATEPPLLLCGLIAMPWAVALDPSCFGSSTDRTDLRTVFPNEAPADVTPPVVGAFSPAAGAIAYDQAITATATDDEGISKVTIYATYADRTELLYEGTGSDFGGSATSRPLSALHTGGWHGAFTLVVVVTDTSGNTTLASEVYTISGDNPAADDTTAPTVTLVSPASLTHLKKTDTITVDVEDDRALKAFYVFAVNTSPVVGVGRVEVVYDSGNPTTTTNYNVAVSTVGSATRVAFSRIEGWTFDPRIRVVPYDMAGNSA